MAKIITRPLDKIILDALNRIKLEWDTFLSDVQSAINNIQKSGVFTMSATSSKVVADSRVTAVSHIDLRATNAAAGALMGSAGHLYISARTSGVSFTVATSNGGNAAGTENFTYAILG